MFRSISRHTFFLDNSTVTDNASSFTNDIIRISFTFWNKLIFLGLKNIFNFFSFENVYNACILIKIFSKLLSVVFLSAILRR